MELGMDLLGLMGSFSNAVYGNYKDIKQEKY
jgi:hypothetical protein